MGKRLLKHRLLNPITNINELNKRYQLIELFLESDLTQNIQKILNEIIDIERLHRKISLQMLHPYEFLNLAYSYENIQKLVLLIRNNFDISLFEINENLISKFSGYMEDYEKIFNMKEIGKYGLLNISNSFFNKGIYKDIDTCQNEINEINNFFSKESSILSTIIEKDSDFVKIDNNDRDGYFLHLTKNRSDLLISKFNKEQKAKYEFKKYNANNVKVFSNELNEKSERLVQLKDEIKNITKEQYLLTLTYIDEKYIDILNEITRFIALVDIIKCGASCVKTYNYTKPIIKDLNNSDSFFNAKEIRHPIIEVINEEIDYIKNDISLSHDDTNGILLCGVNGCGKSSLSKAIGCNIILAQIGFYVPSSEFVYYPYKNIFTRINCDDNIFKGMSSFAVEMDELRSILKYSDSRSIVLGDEVCKGTEETSALAIVSASILRFCENKVNFIFATHFHKLYEMDIIKNLKNVKFKHLSISYDEDNELIIYGRKLMDGPGDNLYGVEIANFLINDIDFIKNARNIRNNILNKNNEILVNKKSNYNNKLYIDCCSICGDNGNTYPLDTHHIKEQNTFEEDDMNKDKLSNIVILCKKHHDEVHYNNLEIKGYIDTVVGQKLSYSYGNKDKSNSRKKYGEKEIEIVKNLSEEFKDHKDFIKVMRCELKKKELNISGVIIKKILSGEY
jgi:DNA mismatch repair protein MutS